MIAHPAGFLELVVGDDLQRDVEPLGRSAGFAGGVGLGPLREQQFEDGPAQGAEGFEDDIASPDPAAVVIGEDRLPRPAAPPRLMHHDCVCFARSRLRETVQRSNGALSRVWGRRGRAEAR